MKYCHRVKARAREVGTSELAFCTHVSRACRRRKGGVQVARSETVSET